MPSHQETHHLPYKPEEIYALVLDVPRYPEFLPWCKAARIIEKHPNYFIAELVVAFKGMRESYTSKIEPKKHDDGTLYIDVSLVRGPFKHLDNHWRFTPENAGTKIDFALDFAFKASLLNQLMSGLFKRAAEKMMGAFTARAEALYQRSDS
jgi:coenzyme Q-binding protein COQ10